MGSDASVIVDFYAWIERQKAFLAATGLTL